MRDFLDSVLEFIEQESLTDDEFGLASVQALPLPPAYSRESYLALREVLEAREGVSDSVKRLKLYFIAKGVNVDSTPTVPTANSNIFIGSEL